MENAYPDPDLSVEMRAELDAYYDWLECMTGPQEMPEDFKVRLFVPEEDKIRLFVPE